MWGWGRSRQQTSIVKWGENPKTLLRGFAIRKWDRKKRGQQREKKGKELSKNPEENAFAKKKRNGTCLLA